MIFKIAMESKRFLLCSLLCIGLFGECPSKAIDDGKVQKSDENEVERVVEATTVEEEVEEESEAKAEPTEVVTTVRDETTSPGVTTEPTTREPEQCSRDGYCE